jgi:hypothetical protein
MGKPRKMSFLIFDYSHGDMLMKLIPEGSIFGWKCNLYLLFCFSGI